MSHSWGRLSFLSWCRSRTGLCPFPLFRLQANLIYVSHHIWQTLFVNHQIGFLNPSPTYLHGCSNNVGVSHSVTQSRWWCSFPTWKNKEWTSIILLSKHCLKAILSTFILELNREFTLLFPLTMVLPLCRPTKSVDKRQTELFQGSPCKNNVRSVQVPAPICLHWCIHRRDRDQSNFPAGTAPGLFSLPVLGGFEQYVGC